MGASETEIPPTLAAEGLPEPRLEGSRCIKGLITGLGLEVAMGFGIYGIWHLWHSLHLFK